jgi:hypothetical protein
VSETQVVDAMAVESEVLARHLEWEQSMKAAVARNLDEHRQHGHTVVIQSEGKIVSLTPDRY